MVPGATGSRMGFLGAGVGIGHLAARADQDDGALLLRPLELLLQAGQQVLDGDHLDWPGAATYSSGMYLLSVVVGVKVAEVLRPWAGSAR